MKLLLTQKGALARFTHMNRKIPVFAIPYASPRIPLPMIALLRLKMDMPKEVFPSNYGGTEIIRITYLGFFRNGRCFYN